MITVSVYQDETGNTAGFRVSGHAGYADSGNDIVCAAVSVLVMNTVNAIESFTSDAYTYQEDEKKGIIDFHSKQPGKETQLLLDTLFLGLSSVQKEYGTKYIKIVNGKR